MPFKNNFLFYTLFISSLVSLLSIEAKTQDYHTKATTTISATVPRLCRVTPTMISNAISAANKITVKLESFCNGAHNMVLIPLIDDTIVENAKYIYNGKIVKQADDGTVNLRTLKVPVKDVTFLTIQGVSNQNINLNIKMLPAT
jgi:hypothetical protein